MSKTIGDYWRSCSNEELATNMVDFLVAMIVNSGIDESEIDLVSEYAIMLEFFNTEYEELSKSSSENGFTYIN